MVRRPSPSGNGIGREADAASALAPALTIAFLASISTGVVYNGVFFIAQEQYGFGRIRNALLALTIGAFYIPAALAVGPALRRISARCQSVTTRRALVALLILMAGLSALPALAPVQATLWIFVAVYTPLMGAMWPMVEAFLSGGRRGRELRQAMGRFNLLWASAVAASAWLMAPLLHIGRPLSVLLGLGLVHLLCLRPALALPAQPPRHEEERHEPHPASYFGLLRCFRWLLLLSYVLMATVTPMMPWRLDRFGLEIGWQTPTLSAWMVSRVVMFWLLQRWGGWHGRWRTPIWSGGALVVGFAGVLLFGSLAGVIVALAVLGVGIGAVYAAALYYAMEVGACEVDAGGRHEAVIGAGYTIGPLLILIAALVAGRSAADDTMFFILLAGMSGILSLFMLTAAGWSAHRAIRAYSPAIDR